MVNQGLEVFLMSGLESKVGDALWRLLPGTSLWAPVSDWLPLPPTSLRVWLIHFLKRLFKSILFLSHFGLCSSYFLELFPPYTDEQLQWSIFFRSTKWIICAYTDIKRWTMWVFLPKRQVNLAIIHSMKHRKICNLIYSRRIYYGTPLFFCLYSVSMGLYSMAIGGRARDPLVISPTTQAGPPL